MINMSTCLIFEFFFYTFCQYGNDKLFNAAPYGPDCGRKFMITCILISQYLFHATVQRFRSVVVITFALHAKGHGFEPRRNLILVRWKINPFVLYRLIVLDFTPVICWCPLVLCIFHLEEVKSILTFIDPKVF